jgi:hypothetical protein
VSEENYALHTEVIKQPYSVHRESLKAVVDVGLGGLSPADLVCGDHPIAVVCKTLNNLGPIVTSKILAVEQHDGPAICLGGWRNIHVRHPKRLPLHLEIKETNGVGICIGLERNTKGNGRTLLSRRSGNEAETKKEPGFADVTGHNSFCY